MHTICSQSVDVLLYEPATILDATRQSDGALVTLKTIDITIHPFEVEIGRFLSSEKLAQDPRSRCVRIIDVLQDPDDPKTSIIVMPLLKPFSEPAFQTIGESVAFFKQAIEVRAHRSPRRRLTFIPIHRAFASCTTILLLTGMHARPMADVSIIK